MSSVYNITMVYEEKELDYTVERKNNQYPLSYLIYEDTGRISDESPEPVAEMVIPEPIPGAYGAMKTLGWKTPVRYYGKMFDRTWEEEIYKALNQEEKDFII